MLAGIGQELNLGPDVAAQLTDPTLDAAVARDEALAEQLGVAGVPVFIAGDRAVTGAVSVESLDEILQRYAVACLGGAG